LQHDQGYFSKKLLEKIQKNEALSPLYRAKFVMKYLPRSFSVGQTTDFDLPSIDIFDIDTETRLVFVFTGCCSNLSISSFYVKGKDVYALSIKGKGGRWPDAKDGYEFNVKDAPLQWDQSSRTLSLDFGEEDKHLHRFKLDTENFKWIALEDS